MTRHCPECGCLLVKPRSIADHRRFFGLLRAAFDNWPESHPFQPPSDQVLRLWALVKAGYHDVDFIEYPKEYSEATKEGFRQGVEAAHASRNRKRGYTLTRVSAGGVEVLTPRSINFETLSQREFAPIREAVEEILSAALGVSADQLLREKAA